jgi:hypothetical protein
MVPFKNHFRGNGARHGYKGPAHDFQDLPEQVGLALGAGQQAQNPLAQQSHEGDFCNELDEGQCGQHDGVLHR